MSSNKHHLMNLIERGEFKEARRFIRTLHHPKQDELIRRVNIAEEKHLQQTQSRIDNLDVIEDLIDKGHFEKARRFVYNMNHPRQTELLLKIEDKRQTDTMKAIVIGRKVENEPAHPYDILESRPLGRLGSPLSFFLGLRTIKLLKNYKRMDNKKSMRLWTIIYAMKFLIFLLALGLVAIRTFQHTIGETEIVLIAVGLLLLTLSPYLNALTHIRLYDRWYHDFGTK